MSETWENKVALISGGTSGIGLATAHLLAAKGVQVIILGRNQERGIEALKGLQALGAKARFIQADLAQCAQCEAVGKELQQEGVILDFLVNNAGVYAEARLEECYEEDYNYMLANNLQPTVFLTKAVLPLLSPGASLVNVASDAGIRGNYGCPLYSAAKGAVVAFTRALAMDLAPGRRVNCVCPGDVDTPLVARQLEAGGYTKEDMAQVYPLERIGRAEEIAHVICCLLAPENSFMTGAIVPVDGGITAKG